MKFLFVPSRTNDHMKTLRKRRPSVNYKEPSPGTKAAGTLVLVSPASRLKSVSHSVVSSSLRPHEL